jgi:hypothetical protein
MDEVRGSSSCSAGLSCWKSSRESPHGEVLSALSLARRYRARRCGELPCQTAAEFAGVESGERRDMAQALGDGNCLEPEDNRYPQPGDQQN